MSNKQDQYSLSIEELNAENIEISKTISGIRSRISDIDNGVLLSVFSKGLGVDADDEVFDGTRMKLAKLRATLVKSISRLEECSLLSSKLPNLDTSDAQRMLDEATKC